MTICGTGEAIHPRGYWLDVPGPNAYFDRGLADALADFVAGGSVQPFVGEL